MAEPSGVIPTLTTGPSFSITARHLPVTPSQIRTVLSDDPETTVSPPEEIATENTKPECPSRVRRHCPERESQILTVWSLDPDTTIPPSDDNATPSATSV